jgi:hypothetical protein
MNREMAHTVFRCWQAYMETGDRFDKLMITPPPSFLPYPVEMMEEAINVVAKEYLDAGDHKTANEIQEMAACHLAGYYLKGASSGGVSASAKCLSDEEALKEMRKTLDLLIENPSLMKTVLANLKASQTSWMESRRQQ